MAWALALFPPGVIAINAELATGYHPTLATKLEQYPAEEWEIRLAAIATHCDVLLDDTYTGPDIDKLCFVLAGRLEVLRQYPPAEIILTVQ